MTENRLQDEDCERFFTMLAESERPLIYAGGGVINGNAAKSMRRLASEYGIPVTTTLMALGASDTRHPLALHMLGMHGLASANYAVEDCDFLIAVGARFDDRVAGDPVRFAGNARDVAHFDVDIAEMQNLVRTMHQPAKKGAVIRPDRPWETTLQTRSVPATRYSSRSIPLPTAATRCPSEASPTI